MIYNVLEGVDSMAEPKKRNQYAFDKKKYDHIHLQTPKGRKEEIQAHAAAQGESLNSFINRAIGGEMERDRKKDAK